MNFKNMKKDISKQLKKLPDNEIVFYQSQDGLSHIEVLFAEENIWLPQKRMAELFGTTKQNVSLHLRNILKDKELIEDSVVKDFLHTAEDGKNYKTKMYSLEAIIAVGYRVNSDMRKSAISAPASVESIKKSPIFTPRRLNGSPLSRG